MWNCTGQSISMAQGDFGIEMPITISNVTFTASDELRLKIVKNAVQVLEKTYSNIQNNKINLLLTEEESALLPVGNYAYSLDWYQNDAFLCNVIPSAPFKVVAKA